MSLTVGTAGGEHGENRLLLPLARHFKKPEFGYLQNVRAGAIALKRILQRAPDLFLVLAALHVDKIENDKAANVSEPQLAGYLLYGFEIHLQDGLLLRALAPVVASIYIDRNKSFGFINDKIPA